MDSNPANSQKETLMPQSSNNDLAPLRDNMLDNKDKKVDIVIPNLTSKKVVINPLFIIIPAVFLILISIFLVPSLIFAAKVNGAYEKIVPIVQNINLEDTQKLKQDLAEIDAQIADLSASYPLVSWMRFLPVVGVYIEDLGHGLNAGGLVLDAGETTITTVEPYLEVLGFKEDGVKDSNQTSQERIDFIVNSIPEILPKADEITTKFKQAESEISEIDPNDYPEEIGGFKVRENLKIYLDMFEDLTKYISESKPLLEATPYLLGMDDKRTYLVIFQNDKELRATGGFLTAYSVMTVDKAKFEPVSSDDIYNLDARYKPAYPAPQAFVDLIKGPYILSQNIRLRDMNYNPDFKQSMDFFSEEASKVGMKNIDGIIAVDTHLLVNLLDALGEIGVPGFGNFSTKNDPRCNCPQVIYELESFADIEGPIIWDPVTGKIILRPPNSDNRKKIIGPLMNSILANAFGSPKEKLPGLVESIFKSVTEKHVLFYLFDAEKQKTVEDFGIAGRIEDFNGDYLHISDSNLGGRKSNMYVKHEVEQVYEKKSDGTILKTVTLTYKNPEKHDGWLNSVLQNWVRIYVPEGSKLIAAEGLEKEYETANELGKTVFSGYFKLRPEGVSKVTFKYELPFKYNNDLKLLIQKQPGTTDHLYYILGIKNEEEFFLKTDKTVRIRM